MSEASARLELTTAPFLHRDLSTPRLMWEVLLSLVPVVAAAAWFFGISALLVTLAASVGACGAWGSAGSDSPGSRI